MIRVGIVGCNYGRTVQLPAFRIDPRCEVVALAGSDATRTAKLAQESNVPQAYGDWRQLIGSKDVDVVTIATPPKLQPDIAIAALQLGKPVFILITNGCDWRWNRNSERTAWYDSARVIRQRRQGDWAPCIEEVKNRLKEMIVARRRQAA